MTTPTTPATDVKRYAPTIDAGGEHGMETAVMAERHTGSYVLASAFDALAAELTIRDQTVESLRASVAAVQAENERLRGELERRIGKAVPLSDWEKLEAALAAATAEVGRLRADAQRYRWLRAGGPGTGLYVADSGREWREVRDRDLDERIDAALAPSPTNSDGDNSEGANSEVK